MDFSLTYKNTDFQLKKYLSILENEVKSLGLNFTAEEKVKSTDSNTLSAFLKGGTKEHIISLYENDNSQNLINPKELIKIKLEVDINPPQFASFENKFRLLPYPYQVKVYDMPSLFAGKLHAVICRAWKSRTKGRDLYDYVFYLSQNAKVNLPHLKARLVQSGFIEDNHNLTLSSLTSILNDRFGKIDFEQAKNDVLPFIKDKSKLDLWSKEFFVEITKSLQAE